MARAPWPLVAIAAIYVATELWQVSVRPGAIVGIRLAIYAMVFLAALNGSRAAAWLWGAVSGIAAITGIFALWSIATSPGPRTATPATIAAFAFQTAFYLVGAVYILSSGSLRAFQRSRREGRGTWPAKSAASGPGRTRVALGREALMLTREDRMEERLDLARIDAIAVRSQTMAAGLPRVWVEACGANDAQPPLLSVDTLAEGFARFEAWLLTLPDFDAPAYRQLAGCGENARRVVWRRARRLQPAPPSSAA